MPNRILREGILTSERVASLDWAAEVFYRRLHSIVDDYGRYEAGHQLLRAKCYPLQTDTVRVADIARWMAACQKSGLLLVYAVNGKQYLEVQDFGQQQRTASKYPAPPAVDSNCEQMLANAHLGVCVVVDEVKPLAPAAPVVREGFARFWAAYPKRRREKKAEAEKVWKQQGLEAFVDLILAHVTAQSKTHDWQKDGGQFVPQPPAYLRGKRWLDAEPVAEQPTVPVPERRKETPEEALAAMQAHFGDSLLGARP